MLAGRQHTANEALQVGCGDRVLSSLEQNLCHGCLVCYPPQFFQGGLFLSFVFLNWEDLDGERQPKPQIYEKKPATLVTFNLFGFEETEIKKQKSCCGPAP